MYTYTDERELKAAWPGRELVYLEKPKTPENVVAPLSAELQRKVNDIMSKHGVTAKGPTKLVAVATATNESIPQIGITSPSDTPISKAKEFLRRLETAREYASKKNQKELDTKIAAIKELINEVFGC